MASTDALLEIWFVTLAFSVFCAIDAVICSTEAEVSSTLADCSVAPCDRDCAVADTCSLADDRLSVAERTSPMICDNFSTMARMAWSSLPTSSVDVDSMRTVRSPWASRSATATASLMGRVIERVTRNAASTAINSAVPTTPVIRLKADL